MDRLRPHHIQRTGLGHTVHGRLDHEHSRKTAYCPIIMNNMIFHAEDNATLTLASSGYGKLINADCNGAYNIIMLNNRDDIEKQLKEIEQDIVGLQRHAEILRMHLAKDDEERAKMAEVKARVEANRKEREWQAKRLRSEAKSSRKVNAWYFGEYAPEVGQEWQDDKTTKKRVKALKILSHELVNDKNAYLCRVAVLG